MVKHVGSIAEYRASEGKMVEVLYRGAVKNTVNDIKDFYSYLILSNSKPS